jgi:hypothetical protein
MESEDQEENDENNVMDEVIRRVSESVEHRATLGKPKTSRHKQPTSKTKNRYNPSIRKDNLSGNVTNLSGETSDILSKGNKDDDLLRQMYENMGVE